MVDMDDLLLLRRYVSNGDKQAISVLIERYQQMVFAACLRRVDCGADADDATQQVFLALIQGAGTIRSNLGSWLYRCAMNTTASMLRSRRNRVYREREKGRLGEQVCLDTQALERETAAILDDCLGELDQTDREILIQNHVLLTPQKAIATSLGVSQQAVAKRLRKAAGLLRRKLAGRGLWVTLAAATVLLTRRFSQAAIPVGLQASLASLPTAPAIATGVVGTIKLGAVAATVLASLLVLECAVDTPSSSPDNQASASAPSADLRRLPSGDRRLAFSSLALEGTGGMQRTGPRRTNSLPQGGACSLSNARLASSANPGVGAVSRGAAAENARTPVALPPQTRPDPVAEAACEERLGVGTLTVAGSWASRHRGERTALPSKPAPATEPPPEAGQKDAAPPADAPPPPFGEKPWPLGEHGVPPLEPGPGMDTLSEAGPGGLPGNSPFLSRRMPPPWAGDGAPQPPTSALARADFHGPIDGPVPLSSPLARQQSHGSLGADRSFESLPLEGPLALKGSRHPGAVPVGAAWPFPSDKFNPVGSPDPPFGAGPRLLADGLTDLPDPSAWHAPAGAYGDGPWGLEALPVPVPPLAADLARRVFATNDSWIPLDAAVQSVPEPGTLALLAAGLFLASCRPRRRSGAA
ncbi:MAG: sigma-70 family RNA polymerase sigma factor [Planctomycetota bacterium]|nr:sigma-70 family RNA polymerase sigma factor [Planctomycetota bacterium]